MEIFQKMGDKNGHAAATKYVEHIQKTLKYEKTQVKERKGRKGATYSSHTISRATGFNTSPRKRPKMTRNKMGTWSHTQGRLVQANLKKHENLTSTLVLENSHAHGRSSSLEFLTLASQPDRVYRYQGISQRLFEQETSLSDPRPEGQAAPFHIQEAALERRDSNDPLPKLPDEDDQRERDKLIIGCQCRQEMGKIPKFKDSEWFETPKMDCTLKFYKDKEFYLLGFQVTGERATLSRR